MRDGRVAYDGPPIDVFTDADTEHGHHHRVDDTGYDTRWRHRSRGRRSRWTAGAR